MPPGDAMRRELLDLRMEISEREETFVEARHMIEKLEEVIKKEKPDGGGDKEIPKDEPVAAFEVRVGLFALVRRDCSQPRPRGRGRIGIRRDIWSGEGGRRGGGWFRGNLVRQSGEKAGRD